MNRRDTIIAFAVAVALCVCLIPEATYGVDWHHDGAMLKPALDVLSGQVLFRDTFSAYGALTTYLQVLALMVVPSLLSIKLLTVGAYGVGIFFLFYAWRSLLPRSLTILACALFALSIPSADYGTFLPWSSVYALMFQSIAILSLVQVLSGRNEQRFALLAGLGCAGVFWCRQSVGLILIGSLFVIAVALGLAGWEPKGVTKAKLMAWVSLGFVGGSVPLLVGIVVGGALPAWWYQNFLWPKKWASFGFGVPYFGLNLSIFADFGKGAVLTALLIAGTLPAIARRVWVGINPLVLKLYFVVLGVVVAWKIKPIIAAISPQSGGWPFLIPVLVVTQAIFCVCHTSKSQSRLRPPEYYLLTAMTVVSLGSLLQYYPVPDPWHIMWALGPVFGLAIFVIWRWLGWDPIRLSLILVIGLLPAIYARGDVLRRVLTSRSITLQAPPALRGMRVTIEQARQFRLIAETIDRVLAKDQKIPSALIGNDGILLCFTPNLENPVPFFVTWDGLANAEEERRRSRYIYERRPLLFVQRPTSYKIDEYLVRAGYVTLLKLPEPRLEIAAPREIGVAP